MGINVVICPWGLPSLCYLSTFLSAKSVPQLPNRVPSQPRSDNSKILTEHVGRTYLLLTVFIFLFSHKAYQQVISYIYRYISVFSFWWMAIGFHIIKKYASWTIFVQKVVLLIFFFPRPIYSRKRRLCACTRYNFLIPKHFWICNVAILHKAYTDMGTKS